MYTIKLPVLRIVMHSLILMVFQWEHMHHLTDT